MLLWQSLTKYVHAFHINSMWLLSIYLSVQNFLDIIILSLSLTYLNFCFVSWNFCISMLYVLFFSFKNNLAAAFSLCLLKILTPWGYWLFFIESCIDSLFAKLAYFYYPKLSINRYAIHLLNSLFYFSSCTLLLSRSLTAQCYLNKVPVCI